MYPSNYKKLHYTHFVLKDKNTLNFFFQKKKNPIKIPNQLIDKNFRNRKLVLRINVNEFDALLVFFNEKEKAV
jgi:hypothetical protein